MKIIMFSK